MKKLTAVVLTLVCMLALAGCCHSKNTAVLKSHRDDFSHDIDSSIMEQFNDIAEVKKVYHLLTNDWFLSDDLSDFSQAVTTDIIYVIPGGELGVNQDLAYSTYGINEEGKIEWGSSAYPPEGAPVPYGFSGLTYEMIARALVGIEYEDYIITYAGQSLSTVFVWVRCAEEDVILTYPTRPDLLGIEIGGIYTLQELRSALCDAYEQSGGSFC